MRAAAREWLPETQQDEVVHYSSRYCEYHLPLENPPAFNLYRTDARYQTALEREVQAARRVTESVHRFRLNPPQGFDRTDLRKAAYDTVHAGVRPRRRRNGKSPVFAEQVWDLYQRGLPQSDIAARLETSPPAVSRTLRRLRQLTSTHENEAQIDPVTDEPFSLQVASTWDKFSVIRTMRANGHSNSSIGQAIGHFPSTVKAFERWMGLIEQVEKARPTKAGQYSLAARLRVPPRAIEQIQTHLAQQSGETGDAVAQTKDGKAWAVAKLRSVMQLENAQELFLCRPFSMTLECSGQRKTHVVSWLTPDFINDVADQLIGARTLEGAANTGFYGWLVSGERVCLATPPLVGKGHITLSLIRPSVPMPS